MKIPFLKNPLGGTKVRKDGSFLTVTKKEQVAHEEILTKKGWYVSAGDVLYGSNLESVNYLFFAKTTIKL